MTTKRIRCGCGRIYDPVKHKNCPDCGAETVLATVPPPIPASPGSTPPPLPGGTAHTAAPTPLNLQLILIIGGAVLIGLLALVLLIRHSGGDQTSEKPRDRTGEHDGPAGKKTGGEAATGAVADLNAKIAKAGTGATIKIPAGIYRGGLIAARPVRLVADGQVTVQTDGKEGLSVRAQGVSIQNVQFTHSGIGELPAISVGDGGALEMDSCKVQSGSAVALVASGNASIKASGSTFTAANGTAVRLNQGARGHFTQCSIPEALIGAVTVSGSSAELHSCAFEHNGGDAAKGAIMVVSGDKSSVTADDCHFTNNTAGIFAVEHATLTITNSPFKSNGFTPARGSSPSGLISVKAARAILTGDYFESNLQGVTIGEAGTLEMQKCNFSGNGLRQDPPAIAGCLPISVSGQGASATVRNTTLVNSAPYALYVVAGGKLILEDAEISGARAAGIVVGDRNGGPPAHVEIRRARILRNGTGIGVIAGSSADVEDSECRDNNDGVIMLDRGSRMNLKKTGIFGSKDHGLYVYADAELTIVDSDIQKNARGAQSGTPRKSAERATVKLENCRIGGNTVFGVGACTKSELILNGCAFDGSDKTNIYKESGAVVQTDAVTEASPPPGSSPAPTAEEKAEGGQVRRRSTPSQNKRRRDDDLYRLFRRFRP